jgi:sporulation protein YlmC with PRC-barrel domain
MKRVTELQFMEVVTEDGRKLGHVFDIRSPGPPEHGIDHKERVVTELVYGKLGLLDRLGIREAEPTTIPWKSVVEIKDRKVVVRLHEK